MLVDAMVVRERPSFRAHHVGVNALSTIELIVVALGLKDTTTADAIMTTVDGSLRRLATSLDAIKVKGFTDAKKRSLAASFEIGVRCAVEAHPIPAVIRSPRDVVTLCAQRMEALPVEEMHVLILNSQHQCERDLTVTRGILNSSLVHPREIFKVAIAESAAAIILVHNHPSGDPTPSADDRNVTDQLVAAGRLLDIPVHDHVIIGKGRYVSFAEAGLL